MNAALRGRNRILKKTMTRYHRTTQKFGIELPENVVETKKLDKDSGTTLWEDAIKKEMNTVRVTFDILEKDVERPGQGRKFMPCHMIFDVKASSLQKKA